VCVCVCVCVCVAFSVYVVSVFLVYCGVRCAWCVQGVECVLWFICGLISAVCVYVYGTCAAWHVVSLRCMNMTCMCGIHVCMGYMHVCTYAACGLGGCVWCGVVCVQAAVVLGGVWCLSVGWCRGRW
jgi:hypothetical protein